MGAHSLPPTARPARDASARVRANHWYRILVTGIASVRARLEQVRARMVDLASWYRQTMTPCRLVLYLKLGRDRQPQALYWGRTFRSVGRWLRSHIGGRLTNRTIYRVAHRYHQRDTFKEFDRKRLALNREHSLLGSVLGRVNMMLRRLRMRETARSADLLSSLAWACAQVEREMVELTVRDVTWPVSLFPYSTAGGQGYVSVGWAMPERFVRDGRVRAGRRHVGTRLSRQLLAAHGVPRRCWPQLRAVDRRMRALRAEHARYAGVIGRIRRICAAALRRRRAA